MCPYVYRTDPPVPKLRISTVFGVHTVRYGSLRYSVCTFVMRKMCVLCVRLTHRSVVAIVVCTCLCVCPLYAAREVASLPQPSHTDHPPPTHHPGQRPPTLGLVLVDRSLDLVTPSSHPDTILDLVLASLPRGHIQQPLSATAKKRTGQVEWRWVASHIPSHCMTAESQPRLGRPACMRVGFCLRLPCLACLLKVAYRVHSSACIRAQGCGVFARRDVVCLNPCVRVLPRVRVCACVRACAHVR